MTYWYPFSELLQQKEIDILVPVSNFETTNKVDETLGVPFENNYKTSSLCWTVSDDRMICCSGYDEVKLFKLSIDGILQLMASVTVQTVFAFVSFYDQTVCFFVITCFTGIIGGSGELELPAGDGLTPSRPDFLRFHAVFGKIGQMIGWCPLLFGWCPLRLQNPGSATGGCIDLKNKVILSIIYCIERWYNR